MLKAVQLFDGGQKVQNDMGRCHQRQTAERLQQGQGCWEGCVRQLLVTKGKRL